MNKKTFFCLLSICCFFFTKELQGQKLRLKIDAAQKRNKAPISNIPYQKNHLDMSSLYKETTRIEKQLKLAGYFSVQIQKFLTTNDTTKVTFSLGDKIETAYLSVDSTHIKLLKKFNLKKQNTQNYCIQFREHSKRNHPTTGCEWILICRNFFEKPLC